MQGKRIKMKKILFIFILLTSTVNAMYIGTYGSFDKYKINNPDVDKLGKIDASDFGVYGGLYIKKFKESYDDWPIGFEISVSGAGYESDIMSSADEVVMKVGYVNQEHINDNFMLGYSSYNEFSIFKIKTNLLFGYTHTDFKYHLEKHTLFGYKVTTLADEKVNLHGIIYGIDSMISFGFFYIEFDLYNRVYFKDKYIETFDKTIKNNLEYSTTIGVFKDEMFGYKIGYKIGLKYLKQNNVYSDKDSLGFELAISF